MAKRRNCNANMSGHSEAEEAISCATNTLNKPLSHQLIFLDVCLIKLGGNATWPNLTKAV